jgi:glycosyltransferase involved in cell wall biosynthesis
MTTTADGPLRVCFVNFFAYPLFNPAAGTSFGGAELQLYTLATELARDPGFAVSFLVRETGQPRGEVREGVAIHGFTAPRPGPRYTGQIRYAGAFWRRLREIDPEIVVQRAAGALTGEIALFCALRRRAFVYMVAHDSDLGEARPPWWEPGWRGTVNWALYRLGLRLATSVIVQHAGQAALLRARYGREGIVRPCVQRFPEPPAPPRERFVLWVARAEPWKQPERFLELAAAFPHERFVMVCPPAESDPAVFRRVRESAARLPNLEFLDFVPYPEIEGYFARALLFVNTSRSEGFPNTFVQAWKHGTPVLSLAVDPDGAIEAHGLGAACAGEPARLHAALATFLGDPGRREDCARRALAWARARHDVRARIEVDKAHLRAVWKGTSGRRG